MVSRLSIADRQSVDPKNIPKSVGRPRKIQKSIFIWLDILGFSETVEEESKYEDLKKLLYDFQKLFKKSKGCHASIVSDGIILQISNPRRNTLIKIFADIGAKQYKFICDYNSFIRGGIAVGTCLGDVKTVKARKVNGTFIQQFVGNGLARAVKLEEKYVNWPVIGTNEKNIKEIRSLLDIKRTKEYFGLGKGYNVGGAELYFIDFLEENDSYYGLLNSKIKEFKKKKKPQIRNKYIWLLRYYHHKFNADNLDKALKEVVL